MQDIGKGGRRLGGRVWKRDQGAKAGEHIWEINESPRGRSQQCRAAPAHPTPGFLSKWDGAACTLPGCPRQSPGAHRAEQLRARLPSS